MSRRRGEYVIGYFTPSEDGSFDALRVVKRSTRRLLLSLEKAKESRKRLLTRFFRKAKREYLDAYIGGVEEELCTRARGGDREATAALRGLGRWVSTAPPKRPAVTRAFGLDLPRDRLGAAYPLSPSTG